MPDRKIIVGIEFNNRSTPTNEWSVGLTRSWIEYRMSIFMKYTLKSLTNQTNQNFTVLIRYADSSAQLIKRTLMKYPALPGNVRFVPESRYIGYQKEAARGYKYLYLVRLDCDDTYRKSLIQQLHNYRPQPGTQALINQNGYVYDSSRHRIGPVRKPSPPFYTLIYETSKYINGQRYVLVGGHDGVKKLRYEILNKTGKRNYMVVVHQKNTLNQRLLNKIKFTGKRSQVDLILKKFI